MARSWLWLLFMGLGVIGCGPDRAECTGPHADFTVRIELRARPLAADTVIHVTYGGSGMEEYSPLEHGVTHEIVFCQTELDAGDLDAASLGAAGGPGADGVDSIYCQLWTGGFAKLEVRTAGLESMTYELAPRQHVCTVDETIVLDSPDGG